MKRYSAVAIVALVLAASFAAPLLAQMAQMGQMGQSAAAPSISADVKRSYNSIKNNLLKEADKMPEAGYSFQATKEERSFGAWVGHVAEAQTRTCTQLNGSPKTVTTASMTTKADLMGALKDSFDACDAAYNALTDANATEAVPWFRGGQQIRVTALTNNIAHDNECYGSMAVYLRLKGIVPPSTESAPQMQQQMPPAK